MNETSDTILYDDVANGVKKLLNSHGFGFQYAVIHRAEELHTAGRTHWVFEAAEFPVQVNEQVTHVDFILRTPLQRTFLIGECKRAAPARSRWVFVKAPYTQRNRHENEITFDQLVYQPLNICEAKTKLAYSASIDVCHVGIEVKTRQQDDAHNSRSGINNAAAQVLRSSNGVINHLFGNRQRTFKRSGSCLFIPVIFTTAELWVTDAKLEESSLSTGKVPTVDVRPVDWLWFVHNQSAALAHGVEREEFPDELANSLKTIFARTIAIVGPTGLEKFLCADLETWLE